jgi:hypothetical protein
MIGLTVMTIPLSSRKPRSPTLPFSNHPRHDTPARLSLPSWRRLVCITIGISYPLMILTAIIATANHFILDAVAGAVVCGLGWWGNPVLLNLVPLEDYFLYLVRIDKPEQVEHELYEPNNLKNDEIVAHRVLRPCLSATSHT